VERQKKNTKPTALVTARDGREGESVLGKSGMLVMRRCDRMHDGGYSLFSCLQLGPIKAHWGGGLLTTGKESIRSVEF